MIITDGEKVITLQELAQRICHSIANEEIGCESCYDGSCPAAAYCRHGHNGMLDFLRKVLE
jgi:hypothetical protein